MEIMKVHWKKYKNKIELGNKRHICIQSNKENERDTTDFK